jgi:hypothetical protein
MSGRALQRRVVIYHTVFISRLLPAWIPFLMPRRRLGLLPVLAALYGEGPL